MWLRVIKRLNPSARWIFTAKDYGRGDFIPNTRQVWVRIITYEMQMGPFGNGKNKIVLVTALAAAGQDASGQRRGGGQFGYIFNKYRS
jgi:hypothetical protein